MNGLDQFKNGFILVPASLILFFGYKKIVAREKDKKIIADVIVVAILMTLTVYLITSKEDMSSSGEYFRSKTNF